MVQIAPRCEHNRILNTHCALCANDIAGGKYVYSISIDEMNERDLQDELTRRQMARANKRCDYCGGKPDTPVCKFPQRHRFTLLFPSGEVLSASVHSTINGSPSTVPAVPETPKLPD